MASAPVTARLPVGDEPQGRRPSRLAIEDEEEQRHDERRELGARRAPMLAMAMSSRTKSTMPSIAPAKPLGAFWPARCRLSARAGQPHRQEHEQRPPANRNTTCLVGERLSVSPADVDVGPAGQMDGPKR